MTVDINCDLGESFGIFRVGQDESVFPHITSCNIACGFHGGDPIHIERAIEYAVEHAVRIGAHPSYPDLQGFGRRRMQIPHPDLISIIKYQVAALKGLTECAGGKLVHVKPHGALYNAAATDRGEALAVIEAIRAIDSSLALMGLAGSAMQQAAQELGVKFIAEAFADRRYAADGTLIPRSETGAVIEDPRMAAKQVHSIVADRRVKTVADSYVRVEADSICIHGDNPRAAEILQEIWKELDDRGLNRNK